ncbi:MAG: hypothetical protein ACFE8N_05095 [Promethearchaeota archaeon]
MSSKSLDQKEYRLENVVEDPNVLKSVVIPFSVFYKKTQKFIYSGHEKIPFNIRHRTYRRILINEFVEDKKEEFFPINVVR